MQAMICPDCSRVMVVTWTATYKLDTIDEPYRGWWCGCRIHSAKTSASEDEDISLMDRWREANGLPTSFTLLELQAIAIRKRQ